MTENESLELNQHQNTPARKLAGFAGLDLPLTRRAIGGLAAGALAALGLNASDAKKKKKKKKGKPGNNARCQRKCSDKTCGSDGCGGSCGSCGPRSACSAQGQCVSTAYEFVTEWGGTGSGNGRFDYPQDVAVDSAGNVYVVDHSNFRIQKFSGTGAYITQWGTRGDGDGEFDGPETVAIGSDDAVYVTDYRNDRVQKFRQNDANPLQYDFVTKWGRQGAGDDEFNLPFAIAIDPDDNVYVLDVSRWVRKFRANEADPLQYDFVAKWENLSSNVIAAGPGGNVYLSPSANPARAVIEKYSGTGTLLQSFPFITSARNGIGIDSIAVDGSGNVFAIDGNIPDNGVHAFDSQGKYLYTFAGERVAIPAGIAIDAEGNVYIADPGTDRVLKYRPAGAPRATSGRGSEPRSRRQRTRARRARQ